MKSFIENAIRKQVMEIIEIDREQQFLYWNDVIPEMIDVYGKEACYLLLKHHSVDDFIIQQYIDVNELDFNTNFGEIDLNQMISEKLFSFNDVSSESFSEEEIDSENYSDDQSEIETIPSMIIFQPANFQSSSNNY